MKYKVFVVFDRAGDVYGQPMFAGSAGIALRGFADEINRADEKNPFYMHPDDFDLFELGTYDDGTGLFEVGQPSQIQSGKAVASPRLPGVQVEAGE